MAKHGYLGDDYGGRFDADHDDGRTRDWSERGEGGDDRGFGGWGTEADRQRWARETRGGDRFMFEDRDRQRGWGENRSRSPREHDDDDDRGFFSRMGEQARSWFSDDDDDDHRSRGGSRGHGSDQDEWFGGRSSSQRSMSHYGREHGMGGFQGDYSGRGQQQGGFGGRGDWGARERQSFSSHPDDHYRSWRDKQMEALDRDYQEYCREREQQFHQSFDSWRQSRQGQSSGQSSQSAQQPSPAGGSGNDELLLDRSTSGTTTDAPNEPTSTGGTESAATLGTTAGNSSSSSGRH